MCYLINYLISYIINSFMHSQTEQMWHHIYNRAHVVHRLWKPGHASRTLKIGALLIVVLR